MSMVRRRILVHGNVQGAFFRDTTPRRAEALGLGGWVRNREDGTVEVVAEGEDDAVDALLAFCRDGPPRAEVETVEVADEEPEGLGEFDVR